MPMTKSESLAHTAFTVRGEAEIVGLDSQWHAKSATDFFPLAEILRNLPQHQQYIEVLPGVPLFAARSPSPVEVVNDRLRYVVDFFRILRRPKLLRKLCRCRHYLHTEYNEWRLLGSFINNHDDRFVRTFAYYCLVRQLFQRGQKLSDTLWDARERNYRVLTSPWSKALYAWLREVDPVLPNLHGRLMRVQYEYNTWSKIFEIYDEPGALFWIDGRSDLIRAFGPEGAGTKEFVRALRKLKSSFVLFYWATELPKLLRGWDVVELSGECCLVVKSS